MFELIELNDLLFNRSFSLSGSNGVLSLQEIEYPVFPLLHGFAKTIMSIVASFGQSNSQQTGSSPEQAKFTSDAHSLSKVIS